MKDLNYELKQLCRRSRDGSYATQADRERTLDLIADQLLAMGYRHMHATTDAVGNARRFALRTAAN